MWEPSSCCIIKKHLFSTYVVLHKENYKDYIPALPARLYPNIFLKRQKLGS